MSNGIFTLGWIDLAKGVAMVVITAIVVALYSIVISNGFDFGTVNWALTLHNMLNIGLISGVSYLFKNLISTNKGSVAGLTPNE